MKYLTSQTPSDGAGSQLQRILSIYLLAKQFHLQYIHSPFHTIEHGFDTLLLERFNQFIQLPSDSPLPDQYQSVYINSISQETLPLLLQDYPQPVLFKVNVCREYLNEHPHLLEPLFPYSFPWIHNRLNPTLSIAIHIRRGDVSSTENSNRFIPFLFYLECIEYLSSLFEAIPFHISLYSEASITLELSHYQERLDKITHLSYHIDKDIVQTFQELVNSDILVAGNSSLSFSAAMIKQKGVVIHRPFFEKYSEKHIEIHNPSEIPEQKEKLFRDLGFYSLLSDSGNK